MTPNQIKSRPVREFVSGIQLAKLLKVSRTRVYILAQEGKLKPEPIRIGTMLVFHRTTTHRKGNGK